MSAESIPAPLVPAGPEASVALDAAGLTDVGQVRDRNEDAYLIGSLQRSLVVHDASNSAQGWFAGESAGTLLIVADGMGGEAGGDVASRTAISAVSSYLLNALPWARPVASTSKRESFIGVRGGLLSALVASDTTIKTLGQEAGTPGMGTTLTAALVLWPIVYVAHVGDSRCYLLRRGQLRSLTVDHNMAQKLGVGPDGEHADYLQSILWNTLGAMDELPRPDLCKLELELGDTLLLCSDGLNKHVTDAQILAVLASGASSRVCCARLVELALDGGGTDNVTVLVAQTRASRQVDTQQPHG
jgi:serine/threonine protein phosphatase PrpC